MLDCDKPTTAGELKLTDLPPIEDLQLSVPIEKLAKVGKVISIVDVLVVVEAEKQMPPLDLDTVLFDQTGQAIGQVFDVFGSITGPHYSIRFTNSDQIAQKCVNLGMEVYILPETDRTLTKFAFVNELRKNKGTDASWENDNEPPPGAHNDSSDEE